MSVCVVVSASLDNSEQPSMRSLMKSIVAKEGFFGLYRGILPNFMKVIPAVSISYVVYEYTKSSLGISKWTSQGRVPKSQHRSAVPGSVYLLRRRKNVLIAWISHNLIPDQHSCVQKLCESRLLLLFCSTFMNFMNVPSALNTTEFSTFETQRSASVVSEIQGWSSGMDSWTVELTTWFNYCI